jgi:hypothetical protein
MKLRLKYGRELEAVDPKKKKSEDGIDETNPNALRKKKDVKQNDVHNHRTKKRQPERDEARAEKEAEASQNLEDSYNVHVTATHQCGNECAGLALHYRNRAHKVEKSIQPEDDKLEPEQNPHNDNEVFHKDDF